MTMSPFAVAQYLTLAWLVSEAAVFLKDRQPGGGERRDVGSRAVIFVAMGLAFWIAFSARARNLGLLPGPVAFWSALGAVLMVAGILLRQRAVRYLGIYFRTQVTLLDDHRLVTDGPYARVRHPSYTGGLISCVAVGFALGSAASLAALSLLPALAFAYRIRVEERALAQHFGDQWAAYRARSRALVPLIW